MIEENVVAEAGTVHFLSLDQMRGAIEELGYTPRQRDVFYNLLPVDDELRAVEVNRQRKERELNPQGREAQPASNRVPSPIGLPFRLYFSNSSSTRT